MGTLLSYSLYSGIFMLAGYSVYRLLLSNEKQPSLNRMALLAIYMVSLFALPLSLALHKPHHIDMPVIEIGEGIAMIVDTPAEETSISIWNLLATIYAAGIAIMALQWIVGMSKLYRMVRNGMQENRGDYVLVQLADNIVPFSFMRYIVISKNDAAAYPNIVITHELGHLRLHHWLDLMLAQGVCVIMWYNPAAWLMRRELRRVHEYQADAEVLDNGINPRDYQMLLIEKAAGVRLQSLANSLNHSNLSKRITMMCKQNNKTARRLRVIGLIPAFALAALAVQTPVLASTLSSLSSATMLGESAIEANNPVHEDTPVLGNQSPSENRTEIPATNGTVSSVGKVTNFSSSEQNATKESSKVDEDNEHPQAVAYKLPEFPGGSKELMKYISYNIRYPEAAYASETQGTVIVNFVVAKDGTLKDFNIIKGVSTDLDNEAIRVLKKMPKWIPGENEKGEPVACMFTLPVSFQLVGPGEPAGDMKATDDAGYDKGAATLDNVKVVRYTDKQTKNDNSATIDLNAISASGKPTYMVDGKIHDKESTNINPQAIESMTVVKDNPEYPNGLIEIKLKK